MYKENLFKLIRSEEVIIWAGAGLSLYAGFPSGKKLCEILIQELTETEKVNINLHLQLPDLAEEFCRVKGGNRNLLNRILQRTFIDFEPLSTDYHTKLSTIPHFKTIITTNYDKLFEVALGVKGQPIWTSKQIPYLEKEKTHIFKAHGDFSELDSIIITKSDYNRFFKEDTENTVFWTVIKEALSTKSVLLLGYDLEDPNTSVIFDKILECLTVHRKEYFLVAPDLQQHKIIDLAKKGIQYINSTAEKLIDELILNLKDNIVEDLEKGITSADTFRSFLLNNKLLPELKAGSNSYKLKSISGIDGKIDGKMNLTLKNDEIVNELNDFFSGKRIGEIEIPQDKLIDLNLRLSGIKYFDSQANSSIVFKSVPRKKTNVDIRFINGFELSEIPVELYGNENFVEIHVKLKNANLIIKINVSTLPEFKTDFRFDHHEYFNKTKDEIELFTFLKNLASGLQFTVFVQSEEYFTYSFPFQNDEFLYFSEYYLNYFENLKIIEQFYNIQFCNVKFDTITHENFNLITRIGKIARGESLIYKWDDSIEMELIDGSEKVLEEIKMSYSLKYPSVIAKVSEKEDSIEIHGKEINLGYKRIEIVEPDILNLDDVLNKKDDKLRIKSKINTVSVTYSLNYSEGV